jgi:hypothetical protein
MEETQNVFVRNRGRIIGTLLSALVIFLLGFIPPTLRARSAAQELTRMSAQSAEKDAVLARARLDTQVARLRGTLGKAFYEANRNNFASAAEQAAAFFDGVRDAGTSSAMQPGSERQRLLQQMLARREEIAADLARADPGAKEKLAAMFLQFERAVQ